MSIETIGIARRWRAAEAPGGSVEAHVPSSRTQGESGNDSSRALRRVGGTRSRKDGATTLPAQGGEGMGRISHGGAAVPGARAPDGPELTQRNRGWPCLTDGPANGGGHGDA